MGTQKLSIAVARAIVQGAEMEAIRLEAPVSIAVVDPGSLLVAFARLDGALPIGGEIAIAKACSAAQWHQSTTQLQDLANRHPLIFQSYSSVSIRPIIPLPGGIVIVQDGLLIGGVGVSGARTPDDDLVCAQAGLLAAGIAPV